MNQNQKKKQVPHWNKQRYGDYFRRSHLPAENKRLIQLQKDLLKLGDIPYGNPRKMIMFNIHFLDIISQFQDEGYLKYQPKEKANLINLFNYAIKESGRDEEPEKWNCTKKGEKLTPQNVQYGGVLGLPIKPAIYWLNLPKSKKVTLNFHNILEVDIKNSLSLHSQKMWQTEALVIFTIKRFTKNNLEIILDCIDKLLQ